MHTKRYKVLFITSASVALLVFIILFASRAKPVAVIVKPIGRGEVQSTIANTRAGTIHACLRAKLSPSIGGQISSLSVKEGDKVKKGQILLEIWNDDLKAKVQLATSEATAAAARAKQACVVADVSQREANRLTQLRKNNLTSAEKADRAVGDAKAKKAACEAATATATVSQAQITVAKAALDRTRLVAPFDGTIAEVNGEVGEVTTPSPVGIATPPAIDIIDTQCLYVSAPIDEVDAPAITAGMPAQISLDAFAKKIFSGRVKRVAPYVLDREKQARTVDVDVEFTDPQDTINMLPGYSADIQIILDSRANVLRIPSEALLENKRVLLYLGHKEALEDREIKIGISNWHFTEVLSGLKEGEQLVISIDREGVEANAVATLDNTNSLE